ncbi:hypothetical protein [Enterobacter sp. P82]|uniref:hypothetical protein n=1 Tax=Enterobacter sp. P82 TaxID=3123033 RepID=UPI00300C6BF8
MSKNKNYSLGFTSTDIARIAKNSTTEVASKQLVTAREAGKMVARSVMTGRFQDATVRKTVNKTNLDGKGVAGSVRSQLSSSYSSKEAVYMFNQAFKKARA